MQGSSDDGDERETIPPLRTDETSQASSTKAESVAIEESALEEEKGHTKSGSKDGSYFKSLTTSGGALLSSVKKSVDGIQKKRRSGDHMAKRKADLDDSERAPPKRDKPPRLNEYVTYEAALLARTLEDAGHWAYGIIATELWIYDDDSGNLFRPDGGTWADMALHPTHLTQKEYEACPMCRVVFEDHPKHIPPAQLAPGVGVPGVLWAEAASSAGELQTPRRTSLINMDDESDEIYWRDVQALARDPDQPYNERLQNAALTSLGWAGGVSFNVDGQRGILIYFTRDSVKLEQLQSSSNVQYLLAAANYVSTVWALRLPRLAAIQEREDRLRMLWRRFRVRLQVAIRFGNTLDDIKHGRTHKVEPEKKHGTILDSLRDPMEMAHIIMEEGKHFAELTVQEAKTQQKFITRKLKRMARKSRGANIRAPPAFTWEATMWSFVGTLLSLLILLNVNEQIKKTYGSKFELTLGPLSSFTASVFVLTAAPASQPRNNIVAYNFAMIIGLCLAYVTDLAVWIRQAISVSITVCAMVKFGFLHAPAAGVALTFASGSQNWTNVLSMTLASMLVITLGTIINNLSDKRQYPTSWGFRPLIKTYKRYIKPKED